MKKLNVRLLNRIKKHLLAEPKRYNQQKWGERIDGENAPACGTRGCIAGWAVFLSVKPSRWSYWITRSFGVGLSENEGIAKRAKQLLGLTEDEAWKLFDPDNQAYLRGLNGVREACTKIDALIAARKANASR